MGTIISNTSFVFLRNKFLNSRPSGKPLMPTIRRSFPEKIRASSADTITTKSDPFPKKKEFNTMKITLACPICYEPLISNGEEGLTVESTPRCCLQCRVCKKSYFSSQSYIDLTAASGAKVYSESYPASTELFRLPLISFLYERGWRQFFSALFRAPGPEKEFEMVKDYLKPVLGGNIIDVSCGSGQFSRLFAKSGLFSHVVALDFSENMLKECYGFIKEEEGFPKEYHPDFKIWGWVFLVFSVVATFQKAFSLKKWKKIRKKKRKFHLANIELEHFPFSFRSIVLVRADISRLPFVSGSVDAVNAGAALHCWPSPSSAVAEISRILRPGGVFVASTFIADGIYSGMQFSGHSGGFFSSERELEDLCKVLQLVNFRSMRNGPFIMISATKPI